MANPLLFFTRLVVVVVFGTRSAGVGAGSGAMLSSFLALLASREEKAVLPLTGVKNSSMRRDGRSGDEVIVGMGVMDISEISEVFEWTTTGVFGVLTCAEMGIDFFFFCLGDDTVAVVVVVAAAAAAGVESLIGEEGISTRGVVDLGNLLILANSSPRNLIHWSHSPISS